MANRTEYFNSVLAEGELTGIRSTDKAVDTAELQRIDTEAMHRINALIVACGGIATAGALVTSWMDDANPAPPAIIQIMAAKIAAAEVWKRWEQYNLGVAARDDTEHRRDSERLRDEVREWATGLKISKTLMGDDGVPIVLSGSDRASGPVVGGPMKEGSYFDPDGYVDWLGRKWLPLHADPFFEAT